MPGACVVAVARSVLAKRVPTSLKYTFRRSSCWSDVPLYLSLSQHVPMLRPTPQYLRSGAIEAVLAGDGLPEGSADLVTLFLVNVESRIAVTCIYIHIGRSGGAPVYDAGN